MERLNERNNLEELSALPKKTVGVRPCSMPPSTLPSSFQVWKKSHFIDQDGCSRSRIPLFSSENNHQKYQELYPEPYENLDTYVTPIPNNYPIQIQNVSGRSGRNQLDPKMDPKKLKRIISNRVSAQKSRMKKLHYVTEMERKAQALEGEIAVLHPQVLMFRNQQGLLQMEQKRLKQEVSARAKNKSLKDAEIEKNKAEVNRLRQLHLTQQQQNMQENTTMVPSWSKYEFEQIITQSLVQSTETGQLAPMNSNLEKIEESEEEIDEWSEEQVVAQMWMPTPDPVLKVNPIEKLSSSLNLGGIEQMLNLN